jgi:sugar lactone lactonase YvrE
MLAKILRVIATVAAVLVVLLLAVRALFGGGARLEDRTTDPELPSSALETVANLDHPPGNVAVAADGRVFFTFHPDGNPPVKVAQLVGGTAVPYPDATFQQPSQTSGAAPHFQTPLAVRIDRQNRLWVLDHAEYARGQPRLLAFDLATNALVQRYDFPSEVAPLLSMLNDFQVAPAGDVVYVAEASPILRRPAIVVLDVASGRSRRLLENHASVEAQPYVLQAPGRDMVLFGVYDLRVPVDSIALDPDGGWLYYGPLSGDRMYRVRTRDLRDEGLSAEALATRVEDYGPKTISDGLTMDLEGNLYVSDPEHSAVLVLTPERRLRTLIKDPRLRWPDGFSFGPDGWLYVTASALQDVLFLDGTSVRAHAPYQIFRFKPGPKGVPGH